MALGDGTELGGSGRIIALTHKPAFSMQLKIEVEIFDDSADDDPANGCTNDSCKGRLVYTANKGLAHYPLPDDDLDEFVLVSIDVPPFPLKGNVADRASINPDNIHFIVPLKLLNNESLNFAASELADALFPLVNDVSISKDSTLLAAVC
ncbi:hypothetical protein SARC_00372 [Sphaeroforma arctica JP610]|uniref:Uncharacterized protein n=1 Tax=Sphaeroforma arctica JP610 TaxID=667725 RepID=A0A0L0GGS8_9EUKA|nr:hypothetical protein SARC_00372 [Sphaeroforma arctica JP610]KNC87548.1 hypothetical protein SARC_00372 [Sphaeroforma arctica JP610]|eukprot:XP_014161450.1 hypothetical protein SARC_00372 [Sphaeroforma arctica JP610]